MPVYIEKLAVPYVGELQAGNQGFGVIAVHGSTLGMPSNCLLRLLSDEVLATHEAEILNESLTFSEEDPHAVDDDYTESHYFGVVEKPKKVDVIDVVDIKDAPPEFAQQVLNFCTSFGDACRANEFMGQAICNSAGRIALCTITWTGEATLISPTWRPDVP